MYFFVFEWTLYLHQYTCKRKIYKGICKLNYDRFLKGQSLVFRWYILQTRYYDYFRDSFPLEYVFSIRCIICILRINVIHVNVFQPRKCVNHLSINTCACGTYSTCNLSKIQICSIYSEHSCKVLSQWQVT